MISSFSIIDMGVRTCIANLMNFHCSRDGIFIRLAFKPLDL